MQPIYTDLFIIGGGINGTAIAADAAGRGLTVTLCEKGDLASATSSASTKLIHGGLRYLEHYEFRLVKKALQEREVLMQKAPNIIRPLEFILPHEKHLRPAWLVRLGLFLYDHLASRQHLPGSKTIDLTKDTRGQALQPHLSKGFSYYDCFTDDARLVVLNALSAKEHGATILPHTEFLSAQREKKHWKITLKKIHSPEIVSYHAKALINVAGPWVNHVQKNISGEKKLFPIELVKGSHIVVPKIYAGDFAYILQNADRRIVFAIPYQHEFTLIGTTDILISETSDQVTITAEEKDYLCESINRYFKNSITSKDIIWSYSGIRCLQANIADDPSAVTRGHKLILAIKDMLPLLTVIGGKLTTHRVLASKILEKLKPFFPDMKPAWTATTPLPGSDFVNHDFAAFYKKFKSDFSWLPEKIANRYASNYGTRAYQLLQNAASLADLGEKFTADLYQKEAEYLIQHEWAASSEDILWRRTKLGLFASAQDVQKLDAWIKTGAKPYPT